MLHQNDPKETEPTLKPVDIPEPSMIFGIVGRVLYPILPLDPRGKIRVPDGAKYLSIEQAAAIAAVTVDELRAAYEAFVNDALTDADIDRLPGCIEAAIAPAPLNPIPDLHEERRRRIK